LISHADESVQSHIAFEPIAGIGELTTAGNRSEKSPMQQPQQPNPLSKPAHGPANADEAALLHRSAASDRAAFDLLYRAYHRRLTRFIERVTRRPHVTEEVLNDTMLVVWRKAHTYDGSSRVSTWIFAIAYRKALKALKRLGQSCGAIVQDPPEAASQDPESDAMQRESRARITRALEALSREQRAVVELTYYHGCAYREIAAIVGCPVDTVKTRMFHARRKLKTLLAAEGREAT
jgi:RNA polymerase sigma factor (sigma-70 family)